MPTIADIRQQYPQYNDMSDTELAGALHQKFYSDMPAEEFNQKIGLAPSSKADAITVRPVDDHGLARRQTMSPVEKAISPITEYPRNYQEMRQEAESQMGRGIGQIAGGFGEGMAGPEGSLAGLGKFAKGVSNVGLGALGYAWSPIGAAVRSVAGQPIEDVTGIPREQSEFALQLAAPGIGFSKLPRAPGVAEPAPLIRPPPEIKPPEVAMAAERLQPYGVETPRAITGGRVQQELGQRVSNVPLAGAPVAQKVQVELPAQLEQARNIIAAEHGAGTGANVAQRAGTVLEDAAAAETRANEAAAAQANQAREAEIAAQEAQSAQGAQAAVGPEITPNAMGKTVINEVRANHDAAAAEKNAKYETVKNMDARVADTANTEAAKSVAMELDRKSINLTGPQTTASRAMMNVLDNFSSAAEARAPLAPIGHSMAEIDKVRQDLNFLARQARDPTDMRAATNIIHAFDDWHVNAVKNHSMPGSDPNALPALLDARTANRDLMERFGYNGKDAPSRLINKIVRGEEDQFTGPVGVSNALTAGGDVSGPLYTQIKAATNNSPTVEQAVRSGTWHGLTRNAEGTPLPPKAVQKAVIEHLHGTGSDVANRVFTPQQREIMRAHADTVIKTAEQRNAARPIVAETGPIQRLADQMLGKGHSKVSDQDLFDTIKGYAREGGDYNSLARFVSQLPQGMRGDLGAAYVRQLGVNQAGNFTLDQFARQWKTTTPQAKAILFGNAGPHIKALDDIATISRELQLVKGKFGNPSGSGAQGIFGGLISAIAAAPNFPKATATAVTTFAGGNIVARILASPAGASSALKYARAVERANRQASPANIAAVNMMQRNLQNTARTIGALTGAAL